ncbi:hypothetical protein [Coleofasciculus sp. F4-SAH-05]
MAISRWTLRKANGGDRHLSFVICHLSFVICHTRFPKRSKLRSS